MANNFDTAYAVTVSKVMETLISTYAASPESLLGKISMLSTSFGQPHLIRPIADPYKDTHLDKKFKRIAQEGPKLTQTLDLFSHFDSLEIDKEDMAGDPQNVGMHVAGHDSNFRDNIEKLYVAGSAQAGKLIYGVADYPNGTAGTVNRPEMAGSNTTAGDWNTQANMRTDLIASLTQLIQKKFYGPPALLAPTICRPMFSEVITNTSDAAMNWIKNDLGIEVIFSPFVHEAATKDDFNCYLIDKSKVHLVLSDIMLDSAYIDDRHVQVWDWETKIAVAPDPIHDGTEYVKGVVRLDARDFSD